MCRSLGMEEARFFLDKFGMGKMRPMESISRF